MTLRKITSRHIILLILFVMIVICSILSFSYAYYSSSINNDPNFISQTTGVECLDISTVFSSSLPSYFSPISNNSSLFWNPAYTDTGYTGDVFGQIGFNITNNCSYSVNVDVLFVETAENEFPMSVMAYYICTAGNETGQCFDDSTIIPTAYAFATTGVSDMENNPYCYTPSTAPANFWNYMAYQTDGPNLKTNGAMCSLIKQKDVNGLIIQGNSSIDFSIRYFAHDATIFGTLDYRGLVFAGKFIVYTLN